MAFVVQNMILLHFSTYSRVYIGKEFPGENVHLVSRGSQACIYLKESFNKRLFLCHKMTLLPLSNSFSAGVSAVTEHLLSRLTLLKFHGFNEEGYSKYKVLTFS